MRIINIEPSSLCPTSSIKIITYSVGSTLLFSVLLAILAFKKRMQIKISYLLFKFRSINLQTVYKHDAYVIYNDYSTPDREFVTQTLRMIVEEEWGYKLHIWDRDSTPSYSTAENIVSGMVASRNIIIIHSRELFYAAMPNNSYSYSVLLNQDDAEDISNENTSTHTYFMKRNNNEWVDFALLTASRMLSLHKRICVVRREKVPPMYLSSTWYPLLYPSELFHQVAILKGEGENMQKKLKSFLKN